MNTDKYNIDYNDYTCEYMASFESFCGCPDCHDPIGHGATKEIAINDLIDKAN